MVYALRFIFKLIYLTQSHHLQCIIATYISIQLICLIFRITIKRRTAHMFTYPFIKPFNLGGYFLSKVFSIVTCNCLLQLTSSLQLCYLFHYMAIFLLQNNSSTCSFLLSSYKTRSFLQKICSCLLLSGVARVVDWRTPLSPKPKNL